MKHYQEVERFKKLLTLSTEGPSAIHMWIQTHILCQKELANKDTIEAFFEAEKQLLKNYLTQDKETELLRLLNEFISVNNPEINNTQLKILGEILHQEENLDLLLTKKNTFIRAFALLKDFVTQNEDSTIQTSWQNAKDILGDLIEEEQREQTPQITPKSSFIQSLKTLSPENYLDRYKCIFDIWNFILNKAQNTSLIDLQDKTILPKTDTLEDIEVGTVYSNLHHLQQDLENIRQELEEKISPISQETRSAKDSQRLILKDAVYRCISSLDSFIKDIEPLKKYQEISLNAVEDAIPGTPEIPLIGEQTLKQGSPLVDTESP